MRALYMLGNPGSSVLICLGGLDMASQEENIYA